MGLEADVEQKIINLLQTQGYQFDSNDYWLQNRQLDEFINEDLLNSSLIKINKNISNLEIFKSAIHEIKNLNNPSLFERNKEFTKILINGITIESKQSKVNPLVKFIDFDNPFNNTFQVFHQVPYKETRDKRIPDIVVYINGLPLIVMELKSFKEDEVSATLNNAYMQLGSNSECDGYRYDIPTLFNYNAFLVISDGVCSKVGTITSKFEHFHEWKSINGEPGYLDTATNKIDILIDGLFAKNRLLDVIKNFIFYIVDKNEKPSKIMAQYHQYFGVNKAFDSILKAIKPNGNGKAGIIWHTQGSGKSFSMVMLAHKLLQEKILNVPTIVPLTDRIDLDKQLYKTFDSARSYLGCTPVNVDSRIDLVQKLSEIKQGGVILTTIGKFDKENLPKNNRTNIIVMTDEVHRSHYGIDEKISYIKNKTTNGIEQVEKYGIEKYIRDALPNATFIGFTGTPISTREKQTTDIFGDIIDTYDMSQSIIDGSTVKIYYESRLAKVWIDNSKLAEIDKYYEELELAEKADQQSVEKSKSQMANIETILEEDGMIELFAKDIIKHYEQQENFLNGKAMIVCQTRNAALKLYKEIIKQRPNFKDKAILVATESNKDTKEERQFFGDSQYRQELASEFKKDTSKYKIAIVCDMWLTGFDVPDLSVMYFIKRLKSHNLMQAIARVNRVYQGKASGLIVDYIGLNKALNDALSLYTVRDQKQNMQDVKKQIYDLFKFSLCDLDKMFAKVDKSDFFNVESNLRFSAIQKGANFVLENEDKEKEFLKLSGDLKKSYAICCGIINEKEKDDANYYLAIRSYILKLKSSPYPITVKNMNDAVQQILSGAVKGDEVKVLGVQNKPSESTTDLLSNDKIKELRESNPPNVFFEILSQLLHTKISTYKKVSYFKAEAYSDKLNKILSKYHDRKNESDTQNLIENVFQLIEEISSDDEEYKRLGIQGNDRAYYDALIADNNPIKEIIGEQQLVDLAHELNLTLQSFNVPDWQNRESPRSTVKVKIKEFLKKHKCPTEYLNSTANNVFEQAVHVMI